MSTEQVAYPRPRAQLLQRLDLPVILSLGIFTELPSKLEETVILFGGRLNRSTVSRFASITNQYERRPTTYVRKRTISNGKGKGRP